MAATQKLKDEQYCSLLLSPIKRCLQYRPRMGKNMPVDLKSFIEFYHDDPLYHWLGLDSSLLYTAHKIAGGMTSFYRQLGVGVERLFRRIMMDRYGLQEKQISWSYQYKRPDGTPATRYLDGRLDLASLANARTGITVNFKRWMEKARNILHIKLPLQGVVFEVREGYKSADSKRQNADLDNLAHSFKHGYLMTMILLSRQMAKDIRERYQDRGLLVLMGDVKNNNPWESSYAFLKQVIGYDLAAFFDRNQVKLGQTTTKILTQLLENVDQDK